MFDIRLVVGSRKPTEKERSIGKNHSVSELADQVLPLIRTRADVARWNVANAHGVQMQDAVAILSDSCTTDDPATVLVVTEKAISSALKVIMRADDSSGIIGDACGQLLDLHPKVTALAKPQPSKIVDWMIKFQFENDCDFFTIDPVAYAPSLGGEGMQTYRARLDAIAARLGEHPPERETWSSPHAHEWFILDEVTRRLAVLDRDADAIIRTHARDGSVAAWFEDTGKAFEEIGEFDLAVEWAQRATDFDRGHQSLIAARYWCELLAQHDPDQLLAARIEVFRRWPSSSTAAALYQDAGVAWPDYRDEVITTLCASAQDAVVFAQRTLKDLPLAWNLAHSLDLSDDRTWGDIAKAYEKIDPLATLPIHTRLALSELKQADAKNYRFAARRLARMRKLAVDTDRAAEVDTLIAELRGTYRRRPRLQTEFDRCRLP